MSRSQRPGVQVPKTYSLQHQTSQSSPARHCSKNGKSPGERPGDTGSAKLLIIVGDRLLVNRSLAVVCSIRVHRLRRLRRVLRLRFIRTGDIVGLMRVNRNSVVLRGSPLLPGTAAFNAVEDQKDPSNELEDTADDEAGNGSIKLAIALGCTIPVVVIIVEIAGAEAVCVG